jgi:malate synthase
MSIKIDAPPVKEQEKVLPHKALDFILKLEENFGARRRAALENRAWQQKELDRTPKLDFPEETAKIRQTEWVIRPVPADLQDRRVEITGPPDRKMVINALNSGANVFMADFEDSCAPTWKNMMKGQIALMEAVRRTLRFFDPVTGKEYKLKDKTAILMVRPRGLHMEERHIRFEGRPVSAAFFDFGLYLFHNARELLERGTGPYFYLPKLENYQEAQLWSDVLMLAEDELALPRGTIRVTSAPPQS